MRGCGAPLERRTLSFYCAHGHQFDIARAGYLNLLQPQDKKTTAPGDSRSAVAARASLLAAGIGRATLDAVVDVVARLTAPQATGPHLTAAHLTTARLTTSNDPPIVVELGSGSGDLLGSLMLRRHVTAIGIELSTAAASVAARQFPRATWVVANADRRLPLIDASIDLMVSVHARRNPAECLRALDRRGYLIVAVPAADDLIELREAVQGDATRRDRVETLLGEHEEWFEVVERHTSRVHLDLKRDTLLELLAATYRGRRFSASAAIERLQHLNVTLASEIVVFAPRRSASPRR